MHEYLTRTLVLCAASAAALELDWATVPGWAASCFIPWPAPGGGGYLGVGFMLDGIGGWELEMEIPELESYRRAGEDPEMWKKRAGERGGWVGGGHRIKEENKRGEGAAPKEKSHVPTPPLLSFLQCAKRAPRPTRDVWGALATTSRFPRPLASLVPRCCSYSGTKSPGEWPPTGRPSPPWA